MICPLLGAVSPYFVPISDQLIGVLVPIALLLPIVSFYQLVGFLGTFHVFFF